jgi:hypothetical protein
MSRPINLGFSLLLAAVVGSVIAPNAHLWGMHFLAYFPVPAQVLFFVCTAIVIAAGFTFSRWGHRLPIPSAFRSLSPTLQDMIVAVFCGLIFLSFASKAAVLGDGQLWITEVKAETTNYLHSRALLTMYPLRVLYFWLNPRLGISAEQLFALTSIIAGTAAIFGWLKLARVLGIGRLTCLLLGFAWGGIELYFGYVEMYTLMAATITWMLVLMIISLRTNRPSWFVPVLGLLAVGFNFSAVVFLPAVAAYSWRIFVRRKPLRVRSAWLGILVVFALTVTAYFVFGWYKGTDLLLPLTRMGNASAFGACVLSAAHLMDLVNGLLLGGGALLLWLVIRVAAECKTGFRWNDERLVLLLTLIFPLAACIMHNPQLGMARDWDIGAVLLVALPVIALVMWTEQPEEFPVRARTLMAAWLVIVIVPWIGVQASEARSLQRFKEILRLDPARSVTGWDYLTSYYFRRNSLDDWGQCVLEALRLSDNTRYHFTATNYFVMKRDWPNARYHADHVHTAVAKDTVVTDWDRRLSDPYRVLDLGNQYAEAADFYAAQQAYDVAARLQPDSPWPNILSADISLRQQDLSAAQKALETLVAKGEAAVREGQSYFAEEREQKKTDLQCAGWLGLSLIAHARNDTAEARKNAEHALAHCREPSIEQLLLEINAATTHAKP